MRNTKFIKIYADFLRRSIRLERPLKVVFDCSNGTAGIIIKKIINNELRIKDTDKNKKTIIHNSKFIILNSRPDGNFPAHGPDPLKPGATIQLQKAIKKHKADLGVIFDADGDRVFFIDNRGRFIDPDVIARLLIWHLKPKKIVIDVRTGWLIRKLPISHLQLLTSKVGHFFIKKLMRQKKADFGAERSGHYYFKISNFSINNPRSRTSSLRGKQQSAILYYDSGILAAIEVINAVSKLPYSLADFIDLLPQYFRSSELNFKFNSGRNYADGDADLHGRKILKRIEKKLITRYSKPTTRLSYIDGLTIEAPHFWFNLRASNTEPLIRLNIEADSREILKEKGGTLKKLIANYNR